MTTRAPAVLINTYPCTLLGVATNKKMMFDGAGVKSSIDNDGDDDFNLY